MRFSDITGQYQLKSKLIKLSLENRISPVTLFCERGGYGALALAVALAQYNSCRFRTEEDSCGSCPSCKKFSGLVHPDLHFSFPVNTTKKITADKKPVSDHFISAFRKSFLSDYYIDENSWYQEIEIENKQGIIGVNEANLIIKKLSLKPFENGCKYLIIWLPERMNQEAANRLLKTLEEPPEDTYILMVAKAPEKIIPTILSRCRIFEVPPVEKEFAAVFAEKEGKEGEEYYNLTGRFIDGAISSDLQMIIETWEKIASLGREKQKAFCISALQLIRRIYMVSLGMDNISYVPDYQKNDVQRWASVVNPLFYNRIYKALTAALADIERNVNSKFIFADLGNRFFLSLQ